MAVRASSDIRETLANIGIFPLTLGRIKISKRSPADVTDMIEILAALSASAAAGLRIGLPLLLIGLIKTNLWADVPILSKFSPQVVVGVLVSWSLFELFASKKLLGQRILQIVQLVFSPVAGAIVGMAVAQLAEVEALLVGLIGIVGGLLALVLQLVQVGWFFRLRGLPMWAILLQDALCGILVLLAFDAPKQGGLIALLLLWLAIRSSSTWYVSYHGDRRQRRRKALERWTDNETLG